MEDYEILDLEGEKDERSEGVILLDKGDYGKTTAEDRRDWWHIREWETTRCQDGNNTRPL